jgi:hypothetical protein
LLNASNRLWPLNSPILRPAPGPAALRRKSGRCASGTSRTSSTAPNNQARPWPAATPCHPIHRVLRAPPWHCCPAPRRVETARRRQISPGAEQRLGEIQRCPLPSLNCATAPAPAHRPARQIGAGQRQRNHPAPPRQTRRG